MRHADELMTERKTGRLATCDGEGGRLPILRK
jgi:hypothetical protein